MNKPTGWRGAKGDKFWTKGSAYGLRYKCSECGKENLGTTQDPGRMHYPKCSHYPPPPTNEERRAAEMNDLRRRLRAMSWGEVADEQIVNVARTLGLMDEPKEQPR